MIRLKTRHIAPVPAEIVPAGRTIPSLLDEVCDRYPNPQALQTWVKNQWRSRSNQAFREESAALAMGLLSLSLKLGDRVCLFMPSDLNFCIADMACLFAGAVDVPIDPGWNAAAIQLILQQTEATTLIVSNLELLHQISAELRQATALRTVILVDATTAGSPPNLPPTLSVLSLEALKAQGKAQSLERLQQRRSALSPSDTATIVYTLGAQGLPQGVMLSHGSLTGNILASFAGIPGLKPGGAEVALLFLPLTHIFARVFFYGHLYYSHRIYFSTPNLVSSHLRQVHPTFFITVPRLLEKAYEKILERGEKLNGVRRWIFDWAMHLARQYDLARPPSRLQTLKLKLASPVFWQWRSGFGGRIKFLISGGAALKPELANVFSAAGIPIFQGYGLTESGGALCSNRVGLNRAGTVGLPIAGVKIALAPDGEVLAQTPYKMQGYYQNPAATEAAIDAAGWLHTGDLGAFTAAGFLQITGHKKNLFKLSTGKYIAPQPIEQQLKRSPLVKQAIMVGAQRKFCTLLIFPDLDNLCPQAEDMCLALSLEKMLQHSKITAIYQVLINEVNQNLPDWSKIKRFRLLHLTLAIEEGETKPTLTIRRDRIDQIFAAEIEALY
jgi:long-chain acyl-CoA synthetase